MKKFNLIFVVMILLLVINAFAQAPDILWAQSYGTGDHDECWEVQQTSDGGYIMVGSSYTDDTSLYDIYLVKADELGAHMWTQVFGIGMFDMGFSVQQTSDDGYIVAGTSDSDFWVIKTDEDGNELWNRTYGGAGEETAWSVNLTNDDNYIVAGSTSSYGAGSDDVYLIKIDVVGDTLWTRTYGTSQGDCAYSVEQTSDGGYILAGATDNYSNAYIIKTDADGNELWTQIYGGGAAENAYSIQQTTDDGYIFTGKCIFMGAGGYDFYLVKIDENGNELWTQTYGGPLDDLAWDVDQCTDGGYFITGETYNFQEEEDWSDVYMIRTDSVGDTLWTKQYGGATFHTNDWGKSGLQTADGGFIAAGAIYISGLMNDYCLVKIDAEEVSADDLTIVAQNIQINSVHPNPFNPATTISFSVIDNSKNTELVIYNLKGQKVKQLINAQLAVGQHSVVWNGKDNQNKPVASGLYFCTIKSGYHSSSRKMILMK